MLSEFNLPRLILLAVLGLAVAGTVMWDQVTLPAAGKPPVLREAPWQLPDIPGNDPKNALAVIAEHTLWGSVAATAPPPLADPAWRFVGVMRNGNERHLMISIENKPLATLKEGDELPGGSKILTIADDHLCLLVNGHKRKIGIYRQ